MSYRLDTEIQSSTLYLDSTSCVSRSPYFKYELATPITCPTGVRMLLSVIGATIPNVINNITENNNQLSMIISSDAVTNSRYTFIFPQGIYSAFTFRDYLNSLFVLGNHNISCVYDPKIFKLSFVAPFDFLVINDGNHITTCSSLIGVAKNDANQYVFPIFPSFPFYTLVMPSTVQFSPSPFIFLKISNLRLSNINSRGFINDTLVRIPVNSNYGEMIQYRPTELNRFLIQKTDINNVEIRFEDINNNPLSLPLGVEVQVIFKFEYIYPAEVREQGIGTISHYFKENPITENEIDDELGVI
jgi:hypothetical protein